MLTYRWRRCGQELMFSWPVSSSFAILHVDLWMLGRFTDSNGNVALMNTMCDMYQFVVVVPVPDKTSATLADYFVQRVLMNFFLLKDHLLLCTSP